MARQRWTRCAVRGDPGTHLAHSEQILKLWLKDKAEKVNQVPLGGLGTNAKALSGNSGRPHALLVSFHFSFLLILHNSNTYLLSCAPSFLYFRELWGAPALLQHSVAI